MTDEISAIVEKGIQEWEFASEKNSVASYKNAEGFFLLALKKVGKPVPRIHAFLAMVNYELAISYQNSQERNANKLVKKTLDSAKKHAEIALQHNPLEFRAQLIKTYIASDNVLYLDGGLSNLVPQSRGVSAIFEFAGRAVGTGAAAAQVRASKAHFNKELGKLLSMYREYDAVYVLPAVEFYFLADKLLMIADFCLQQDLSGVREIYSIIANVKLGELGFDGIEDDSLSELTEELSHMKTLAEARLMALEVDKGF